jgi:hypothetical protein
MKTIDSQKQPFKPVWDFAVFNGKAEFLQPIADVIEVECLSIPDENLLCIGQVSLPSGETFVNQQVFGRAGWKHKAGAKLIQGRSVDRRCLNSW